MFTLKQKNHAKDKGSLLFNFFIIIANIQVYYIIRDNYIY